MAKFRTHYDNLGVSRTADPAVIKAAYKALAQKYHPDRNPHNPDAERIIKIINEAYQVLIDPIRRAEHDRWIDEQKRKAGQSYQSTDANQNSNTYQNTANSSSSASHSNERASQNTHNQTNGYRYDGYPNGNQDNRNYQGDDKQKSNNQQKHYDENDNREMMDKPSFWSFGRMRRTTYILLSVPAIFILMIVRIAVYGGLGSSPSFASLLIATMIELVPWSFLAFIGAKRLHDCNYKAWWIVMPFVVIAMWFWKPTQGANRFGDDPRDDYFDDKIEIEKDNSIWIGVAIFLFYNLVLSPKIIDEQQKYENRQNNTPTYQDNQPSNTQTPNISPNDIVTPNINNEPQLNPQLVLVEAQNNYNNAVANINAVWNSLHPSTQDFLRAEQRAINKKREADCTAYGNAQSTDKDLAKAYRYACEVPQLNERAEFLKTQLNTVVTPPAPIIEPQPLPKTGATNKPNLHGNSPLQIKTNAGSHYWVKIVNSYNEKDELASFFIRGGETLDVNLPIGSYVVKYAYGDTWYGRDYLFGEDTGYSKADEVLEFYHGQGYVIELIQQLNGNLHTTAIDESQF